MVIAGFVLAGGLSRRMGRDKATLPVDGVPMAARVAQVLAEAGCAPVTLVGRQPALRTLGLPVLAEGDAEHHPLYGVAAALEGCATPLALFCPCDLVAVSAAPLVALVGYGAPCVAASAGRRHPLLVVLPRSWAARARALAQAGGAARALTEGLPGIELPESALFDANRPEDLPLGATSG